MLRLFANAKYDFIAWRYRAYAITALIFLVGLGFLVARGVNYSIEFTGGTLVQVTTHKVTTISTLRGALDQSGLSHAEIQAFGSDSQYVVRARAGAEGDTAANAMQVVASAVSRALDGALGADAYKIE